MTVLRSCARMIAAAATAGLCLAPQPASAANDYPPGRYKLKIYEVQIEDISHRIDPHEHCAEIYGTIHMEDGNVAGGYAFFRADRDEAVEVCEENRPLNEGIQSGSLKASPSGKTEIISTFTGDKAKDHPFVFVVDLWDRDPAGGDQQLMHKTVYVWPPQPGVMPTTVSDAPEGSSDSTVYFRYDITNITPTDGDKAREDHQAAERKRQAFEGCLAAGGSREFCQKDATG
ncbi:hypothetical protein ABZ942_42045 [Nocardia sp. NPDC046473]|uniref:hypothetical protein n=1 Tax=Nocardia sp. NPDC046473 TaxID=3155733 RepID=UPI0033C098AF